MASRAPRATEGNALKLRKVRVSQSIEPLTNACESSHFCACGRTVFRSMSRACARLALALILLEFLMPPPSLPRRNTHASAMAQRPLVGEATSSTATTGGSLLRLHLVHLVGRGESPRQQSQSQRLLYRESFFGTTRRRTSPAYHNRPTH